MARGPVFERFIDEADDIPWNLGNSTVERRDDLQNRSFLYRWG